MLTIARSVAVWGALLGATSAFAQSPNTMEPQKAQRAAEMLTEKTAKIESPQVEIEADPSQAVGLEFKKEGILAIPQKGLDESAKEENSDARSEQGAGLAYLFMTSAFSPVIDGKPVKAEKLRTVKIADRQGNERTVTCLLLAARRISEEDWRLYVYGAEKKPLADVPFEEVETETPDAGPLRIDVENTSQSEGTGTFAVTVFGKYKAGFKVAYQP